MTNQATPAATLRIIRLALLGGVAWLVAGEVLLYLTGLGVLIVALLLVPVPEET